MPSCAISHEQNVILPHVHKSRPAAVYAALLKAAGSPPRTSG